MPPPRPHPLARSALVERLNHWLDSAWRKGWLSHPPLDPEAIWAKGARGFTEEDERGGRDDAAVADFRDRLQRLCAAVEDEANLNPLGRAIAHGQLARVVRQQFALGKVWRERPELRTTPLAPPILVVGQMRSGTTRIHRLLAADPAHSGTRFCDSWDPVPRSPDMRPVYSSFALFLGRQLDPWLETMHPFGATRADEELGWLAGALNHSTYEAQWRIPSYTRFSEAADPTSVYAEFARILRTDGAHHRTAHRPRVLKCPQFSEDLSALLAQLPDARIVTTDRYAEDVAQSAASLVANQMTIQSDSVDLNWIEAEWRRKIALREERAARALLGLQPAVASFEALNADWRGEIARIYRELGLALSAEAMAAMEREMARAARGDHSAHAEGYRRFAAG